jgi:SAM-dependent methyltransferase
VDSSAVALELLRREAPENIEVVETDLEAENYRIEPARYDLICDTCFLHRPLFGKMRSGLRPGGVFVGVFPLEGMNPAWLMSPGELEGHFAGWEIVYSVERPSGSGRLRAEIIARRPLTLPG